MGGGKRTVRIPLEVGQSAVNHFTVCAICLPLGFAILIVCAILLVTLGAVQVLEAAAPGLLICGFGFRQAAFGWRVRPADLVIEERGFRIDGGEHHGLELEWRDIKTCKVGRGERKDDESTYLTIDGDLTIAEADDEDEIRSLEQAADAIRACIASDRRSDATKPRAGKASVLACGNCGAPVAPSSEPTVACSKCRAAVPIPPDLRERVRAALDLPRAQRKIDRLVERLLDQPGARSTMFLLLVSLALLGSAWPVTVWAYVHVYRMHQLTLAAGVLLALLPMLLIVDGYFLSRLRLVDRRALASLVTVFGANPPINAGEPARCRSCWAPLRDTNATVVRCVFCDASNITGVDLRALATRNEESADSLETAMFERNMARRGWWLGTLAAALAGASTVILVWRVVTAPDAIPKTEDLRIAASGLAGSADGSVLLFRDQKEWKVIDVQTRATKPLPFTDFHVFEPLGGGRFVVARWNATREEVSVVDESGHSTLIAATTDGRIRDLVGSRDARDVAVVMQPHKTARISTAPAKPVNLDATPTTDETPLLFAGDKMLTRADFPTLTKAFDETNNGYSLSPDGHRIVFASSRETSLKELERGEHDNELFIIDLRGAGRPIALTDGCGDCSASVWSTDGFVYYVSRGTIHRTRPRP